jgi:8-oxo-dGTP diphosphatase
MEYVKLKECVMAFDRGAVSLAVDCVVFGFAANILKVLCINRRIAPFAGMWALPGGFVEAGETLREAAYRELLEETGIDASALEELGAFDAVDRDPRGRVVSVAFVGLLRREALVLRATCDARDARWFDLDAVPELAFDHGSILARALAHLRENLWLRPSGLQLLGAKFTLTEAQRLFEGILGARLDVRNFRKRILATGMLIPLEERECGVAHRAARYFACRDATT